MGINYPVAAILSYEEGTVSLTADCSENISIQVFIAMVAEDGIRTHDEGL